MHELVTIAAPLEVVEHVDGVKLAFVTRLARALTAA
jgi:hypothetical protein